MRITLRLAVGFAFAATLSWGSLLTNGSFEAPIVPGNSYQTYGMGSTGISGWTVTGTGGNIALISEGPICCGIYYNASDGTQLIDMSGDVDNGAPKGLVQSVNLDPGVYLLSFDVGNYSGDNGVGSPFPSTVDLLVNGALVNSYTNSDNTLGQLNWKTFTYSFGASGVTTIEFLTAATGADNFAGLDNVTLEVTDTPEPATFAMLGGAGLLMAAFARRRARR